MALLPVPAATVHQAPSCWLLLGSNLVSLLCMRKPRIYNKTHTFQEHGGMTLFIGLHPCDWIKTWNVPSPWKVCPVPSTARPLEVTPSVLRPVPGSIHWNPGVCSWVWLPSLNIMSAIHTLCVVVGLLVPFHRCVGFHMWP